MKASELRVGNIVQSDGSIFTIEPHHLIDIEKTATNPITLTKEWLVKFGFEIHVNINNEYLKKDVLYFYGKGLICQIGEYSSESLRHIKYVNQLQNLYYALTGEELEIINP